LRKISETCRCRSSLSRFCEGDGLDIGYGGDPIIPSAICIDLEKRYASYENFPQHLHGDGADLHWFKDNVMDYVYSSHVLEDFENTESVLKEWIRVVKPNGRIILFLPDEQAYRNHCTKQGLPPNAHHIHETFSLNYLMEILKSIENVEVEHSTPLVHHYSFELVLRKK